jgi:DHA2 family lincomycin resistance protein-like MFS transporter
VQQLAGAAGIALFVTVMTTHSASLTGTGMAEVPATAAGIQTAFLYGAVISLVAVVASLFVRRPAAAEGGESA